MQPILKIKRAYEGPSPKDGYRILVDRLWPRGLKKEDAGIDAWEKDLAPTTELRKWYAHVPERWTDFEKKYKEELKENAAVPLFIEQYRNRGLITLVYAAKDAQGNNALVLQKYLEQQFRKPSK